MQAYEKCTMCRYFMRHYAIAGIKLVPVNCGHCVNGSVKVKRRFSPDSCVYFSPREDKRETVKSVERSIADMKKILTEIRNVLNIIAGS